MDHFSITPVQDSIRIAQQYMTEIKYMQAHYDLLMWISGGMGGLIIILITGIISYAIGIKSSITESIKNLSEIIIKLSEDFHISKELIGVNESNIHRTLEEHSSELCELTTMAHKNKEDILILKTDHDRFQHMFKTD